MVDQASTTVECTGKSISLNGQCVEALSLPKLDGRCGSATQLAQAAFPKIPCASGFLENPSESGTNKFSWTCSGSNGGNNASCEAQKDDHIDAQCHVFLPSTIPPSKVSHCDVGTSTGEATGSGNMWTSFCNGLNARENRTCQSERLIIVNATCGSAAGGSYPSRYNVPNGQQCVQGNPSVVSESGLDTFSWTCFGENGGTSVGCTAINSSFVHGECGSQSSLTRGQLEHSYYFPITCAKGIKINELKGSDKVTWSCQDSAGNGKVDCRINIRPCSLDYSPGFILAGVNKWGGPTLYNAQNQHVDVSQEFYSVLPPGDFGSYFYYCEPHQQMMADMLSRYSGIPKFGGNTGLLPRCDNTNYENLMTYAIRWPDVWMTAIDNCGITTARTITEPCLQSFVKKHMSLLGTSEERCR